MEIWDLYTREGIKLDKTCERGDYIPDDEYHLVVHIIIKNSMGEYLVQKRSDTKDLWPGQWAFTGGSAIVHETSELAALRELSEETSIELTEGVLKHMTRLHYDEYFADLWFAVVDADTDTLVFQEEEVSALDYKSKEEILKMQRMGIFHHYREDYIKAVFSI